MDLASAESLLALTEDARAGMRRDDSDAVDRIERRYAELREAMEWFLDHDRPDDAFRFATALVPFWIATKRIDDGHAWYERALRGSTAGVRRRARATYDHGYLVFWAGRYELAEQRFTEARKIADGAGDHNVVALALAGSARVALKADPGEAARLLRQALEITRDEPESEGHSSADHVLGVALQMAGDLEGARDVMAERLERARTAGNEFTVMIESANMSMVERQLGNLGRAEALSLEALRIVSRKGDEMATPWVINGLAAVTAAQGQLERAATLHGIAESLLQRAGGEWPPDEREQFDGTLAVLQAGLPLPELEAARATGSAMTLEEGVAFALSSPDADARNVTELLDAIPGALDRARRGAREARSGTGTALDDL